MCFSEYATATITAPDSHRNSVELHFEKVEMRSLTPPRRRLKLGFTDCVGPNDLVLNILDLNVKLTHAGFVGVSLVAESIVRIV